MSNRKYRGVEYREEVESTSIRLDTRSLRRKAADFFSTTDGVIAAMMAVPLIALMLIKVPFAAEVISLAMWFFYRKYVKNDEIPQGAKEKDLKKKPLKGKTFRAWDFPYRVPFMARILDGSYPNDKIGEGITFLGKEISSKLEIWTGNSDLRTHMLVLGTTGSGKTEMLLGLVYNALVQNSGFIYTDGKGDVALFNNVFRLARYLGREDDLVTINFLTSGRDFLDKQKDRTTNTMNPFALGSSGMLIELIISLMDDGGSGGDMWKGRAIAFVAGLTRALCFLRDRGYLLLDSNTFIEYFELPVIERLVWDKTINVGGNDVKIEDPLFDKVLAPLKAFVLTLPGYKREAKGNQEQKTVEQHGFITMQLTRLFGDMSFTYGYLFQTTLGEVDMYDVVINRRILVVLLPALERAPDSLKMLGKLIVGAIKQMMAGCLGNRLEGSVREIVTARPTNAAVPFYVVLDEYGYYAVLGFAVAPAQARSLGFPQPKNALVRMASGEQKRMGDVVPGDLIRLPNNSIAPVKEVLKHGLLPCSRLVLKNRLDVEAANVHHWPVRKSYQQHLLMTTQEIRTSLEQGAVIELSSVKNGELVWDEVIDVAFSGVQDVQCLVVDDPLHCYLTDHDIVTHNCITFAAQDFSSLQKASKEEADATWENTNVRCVGRITSGSESETFRRIHGVANEATVQAGGGKEHKVGELSESYVTVKDTRPERVKRIEFDDLAAQENGEFTFLIGKKSSGGRGGVRVIRARTFYTQVDEAPAEIRVNHFLKVEPPRAGIGDQDVEIIDALEMALRDLLVSGKLREAFPDKQVASPMNAQAKSLALTGLYIREAMKTHRLSLGEAIKVALVCAENEVAVQQQEASRIAQTVAVGQEPEETDAAMEESIVVVREAPVESPVAPVASSGAMSSYLDDDAAEDEDGETSSGAQETTSAATDAATGDAKGKGGGESGGGPSSVLIPIPDPIESEDAVRLVGSMLSSYISDLDLDAVPNDDDTEGAGSGTAAAGTGETENRQKISLLTLRPVGEGDEPSEIASYLEETLVNADLAIGEKTDPQEIKADAKASVQKMEEKTSYVEGPTPEPATLTGFDDILDSVVHAAESNYSML